MEKEIKMIEEQGENQIKAIANRVDKKSITSLLSEELLNNRAIYKLNKIVEIENKIDRDDLILKASR